MLVTVAPLFELPQGSSVSLGPSKTCELMQAVSGGSREGIIKRLLSQSRKGAWRIGLGESELRPRLEDQSGTRPTLRTVQ